MPLWPVGNPVGKRVLLSPSPAPVTHRVPVSSPPFFIGRMGKFDQNSEASVDLAEIFALYGANERLVKRVRQYGTDIPNELLNITSNIKPLSEA